MKYRNPKGVIISITNQCNSRCLACDIWKKKGKFISPKILEKLPQTLKDIDITGGEPFLHPKLVDLVKTLKKTCPKARLLITTNGFLPEMIKKITPRLLKTDKNLAIRVSLDGMEEIHDKMKGVKGAFKKAIKSLTFFRQSGVKDLGVIFTLSRLNVSDLPKVLDFCRKEKLQFSLNLIHDSPIYFGKGHLGLRPNQKEIKNVLKLLKNFFLPSLNPKSWVKIWFYQSLIDYNQTGKRPLKCGAGESFFYLSPSGEIYPCHLKNWPIGDLEKQSFNQIWQGNLRKKYLKKAHVCHDCWMVCTVKQEAQKNKLRVFNQLFNPR